MLPPLARSAESPYQLNSPSHHTTHLTTVPSDITLLSQPTLFAVILPLDEYCSVSIVAQLSRSTVASTHPSARHPLLYRATATLNCHALCPLMLEPHAAVSWCRDGYRSCVRCAIKFKSIRTQSSSLLLLRSFLVLLTISLCCQAELN